MTAAAADFTLWCYLEGHARTFKVIIPSSKDIYDLKKEIHKEIPNLLSGWDAKNLTLVKTDVALDLFFQEIDNGQYRPNANDRKLRSHERISAVWPEGPSHDKLHVFIALPDVQSQGSPVVGADDRPVDTALVREYNSIFIKVNEWGEFEDSDIALNGVREYVTQVPDFVAASQRKLDSKPGLAREAYHAFKAIDAQVVEAYIGHSLSVLLRATRTPEEFDPGSVLDRLVGLGEAVHLAYIACYDWGQYWTASEKPLKEPAMNVVFFHCFAIQPCVATTVLTSTQSLPFQVITECVNEPNPKRLRRFQPRSDLMVLRSNLPRLLVEVNSAPRKEFPEDLTQMLLVGAAIVRFANKFLDGFKKKKDFVLFAMYVWDDAHITRYSLFQGQASAVVYYVKAIYWLNTAVERAEFARQLYNLRDMEKEGDGDAKVKIERFQSTIGLHGMKYKLESFHTGSKKRRTNNEPRDDQGAGGGAQGLGVMVHHSELRAHGYEVEPPEVDIVDRYGGVMEPLSEPRPSHILTVYRQSNPNKRFIAKKVHEESNELKIFQLLNTFQPKSEHIISLHESFQTQSTSWAILPEMDTVADYVSIQPDVLYGRVTQLCWGLIRGVMYLHKFRIAHRDIKPDNLVVDSERNFSLKIIDFDVAMRVEDEDEVVEGQCGTKGWMAPEMVDKLMYSPIKADRWSTGAVILYLLDALREEDTVLRMTGQKLTAHDPEQRPSMLQVAGPLPDVVNERKASRSLQDAMEVYGESAMLPRMKKPKLSTPQGCAL